MTREAAMIEMHEKGMSYTDIGKEFGLSRQRVFQLIGGKDKTHYQGIKPENCVYEEIRKFLIENRMSIAEFSRRVYGDNQPKHKLRLSSALKGSNTSKMVIDGILDVTGLTYEQAFKRSDTECQIKKK